MATFLIFSAVSVNAQVGSWGLFADLMNQINGGDNQSFNNNLNGLGGGAGTDLSGANEAFDGLFDVLGNDMPAGGFDESYNDVWGAGFGLLSGSLPDSGLDIGSQDTILGAFSNISGIFQGNSDSLGGAFGQYENEFRFDTENWDVVIVDGEPLAQSNFNQLENNFDMNVNPDDPASIADIIGSLFNADLFPDLEIAFGIQESSLKYWGMGYRADAKVIRVGSVPRFNQGGGISQQFQLPVEARWHVQASWLSRDDVRSQGDANLSDALDEFDGFSPLLFRGDFAMMATPVVGSTGNLTFRFITSLGMEAGTYAPAHKNFNGRHRAENQGFATGFGPQVGTGFSVTAGQLTMYSLATVARGDTFKSASPYRFSSRQIEAGIRFGNIINVRYSQGMSTWQPDDNRYAAVEHQVTIGIILQELNL